VAVAIDRKRRSRKKQTPEERRAVIARMLTHPVRVKILDLLTEKGKPMSPKQLAEACELPLANIAYHVGLLDKAGFIVLRRREPRRGAVEHFYGLDKKGRDLHSVMNGW
jgi:DNA-binding transcriptional ArsR family regulator